MITTKNMLLLLTLVLCFISGCNKLDIKKGMGGEPIPGGDHYVATWGDDNNPGTFEEPWASWQKAFIMAEPGDTVYFRGGVYKPANEVYGFSLRITPPTPNPSYPGGTTGHNGEPGNPICYFNYPGETPIMDCSSIRQVDNFNAGLTLEFCYFMRFRGLTIRNVYQRVPGVLASGLGAVACNNLSFENMTINNIGGRAFGYLGGYIPELFIKGVMIDSTQFINCDAYNLCDSLCNSPDPAVCESSSIGGIADGFKYFNSVASYVLFEGCRAWHHSDNGFDISGSGIAIINHCWTFSGGAFNFKEYAGEGSGIKFGAINIECTDLRRVVTRCISAYMHSFGFDENNSYSWLFPLNCEVYNNTSFNNEVGFGNFSYAVGRDTLNKYRNNIDYKSSAFPRTCEMNCGLIEEFNSWDSHDCSTPIAYRIPITDEDFVSLNPRKLSSPRQPDGSLPKIDFLRLAKGSGLIDAGIDVGLPGVHGSAPDLGAFESDW